MENFIIATFTSAAAFASFSVSFSLTSCVVLTTAYFFTMQAYKDARIIEHHEHMKKSL